MTPWLTIIGIGEDGVEGLGRAAREALAAAVVIFGGRRHLDFLDDGIRGTRVPWPTPFSLGIDMIASHRGEAVVVLASGDPLFYGMGATLTRHIPVQEMRILPFPSSFSLAAARMAWPLQDVTLLSVHGRPLEIIHAHIQPGNRLLILSNDGETPADMARLLKARGFGESRLTVLEHLGGPRERRFEGTASGWAHERAADLNVLAVECRGEAEAMAYPLLAGLPDDAFENDGQLTKRDVRAATLARLAPMPRALLWDVGAGCGSIGIEWMRAHPTCRAIAIEAHAGRQAMIERNRLALGVPGLELVGGEAPAALQGLEAPDAVFIGGGFTDEGVAEACWRSLKPGGRFVANAVTIQSEAMLVQWQKQVGGELTRLSMAQAGPLGGFDVWRQALPVTMLMAVKPL
ncbi:precorrin-6y C5,15-methyltransferase (decarboxylating) subunit CbiE [Phyllobacterium salinisoli]|uniref:Precorrin-6y C5,15-methyltransferase (Decarboxylating) subunit CbiE n=1 Tax=Phyllobacterium salinisoli TaxID=1899321 RepID=A0A368K4S4_9HYPH|nr:precorrin-6y C5,15-methyltransferase (decarboxylating) subunit CbiE [Phyllobacterium salinisoli]RCS24387.1 precorrin-6y C5,15-methyltransferase (decarboxylating) subunit CbiE [Phyllobacterium salinisoli]